MRIVMIAAVSKPHNGLSFQGKIPWKIPEDMTQFKYRTLDRIVIMGGTTFRNDFHKQPLPGRVNIVLTRNPPEDRKLWHQPDKRLYYAQTPRIGKLLKRIRADLGAVPGTCEPLLQVQEDDPIYVIGGQSLYDHFMTHAERLYMTEIQNEIPCDRFFPDYSRFKEEFSTGVHVTEGVRYKFKIYCRKK